MGGEDQFDRSCIKRRSIALCKGRRNIRNVIKRWQANWIGHILRRNCLLKHIIEGKIEGKRRSGRRCKHLLDDLKEKRRYWNLKGEELDYTVRKIWLGRGCGCVGRQTTQ
jgi:hypothetical protein